MAETVSREDLEFLETTDRLLRDGLTIAQIAERQGCAPGTVTYRLHRHTLRVETLSWLADKRTGQTLAEMIAAGELLTDDEPAPEPAAEAVA